MTVFKITSPEGDTYEIDAPEGATEEEVLEFVEQHVSEQREKENKTPPPVGLEAARAQANIAPSTDIMGSPIGGFVRGMRDIPDAGAELITRGLEAVAPAGSGFETWAKGQREDVQAINRQAELEYQRDWRGGQFQPGGVSAGEIDPGRLVGNIAATLPLAAVVPGGAAASLPARIASGGGAGTIAGLLQPVPEDQPYWETKGEQGMTGFGFGAIAPPAITGVSRLIKPQPSPAVSQMLAEGQELTPGQIAGGIAADLEEKAMSIPIVGTMIRSQRAKNVEFFNRRTINKALMGVGAKLNRGTEMGHKAIDEMHSKISAKYTALLPKINIGVDKAFGKQINNLDALTQYLTPDKARQFQTILKSDVLDRFIGGQMSGNTLGKIQTKLRTLSEKLNRGTPDDLMLKDAVDEIKNALQKLSMRSNPQHAAELKRLHRAYQRSMTIKDAASARGSEGIFSPAQLTAAVRKADKSRSKSAFARGKASMQREAEAAQSVLANRVPDSGTPGRLFAALAAGGATVAEPSTLAALGGLGAAYTTPAQRAIQYLMTRRGQGGRAGLLSGALQRTSPAASVAAPSVYGASAGDPLRIRIPHPEKRYGP